ncbi:hypothetical protein like AT1G59960 [Hibiscus trionum]|uniref:NADP-dependent oxidoreductase domain-containing protein n=1 Tax=Hibiscus trionum TaxID=183268 RepID=A0A9W7I2V3_HIBTR|nr:hypothetical protein like AT1G59960 [Hibiscus trionum]
MDSNVETNCSSVPQHVLSSSGQKMPVFGLGTAVDPPVAPEVTKQAVVQAIKLGYRHFDTASVYGTEQPVGEAIIEAISLGLIKSRDELFITSKLWCNDAHGQLVVPALHKSLQNLKLEYLDLYLIHWPVSLKPGSFKFLVINTEDVVPMDFGSVWLAMEECQRLGLTKSIGVSNFSCKKLAHILSFANIPPAVNQVELNPMWNQKKLREFCNANGIFITAYSLLGAPGTAWGSNRVMDSDVLKEIAEAKGKTIAQICGRWAYEVGVSMVVKSFNGKRMKQNLDIFRWSLSEDEVKKMNGISQSRHHRGDYFISKQGPYKTLEEFWDGEI